MRSRTRFAALAATLSTALLPAMAHACAVCQALGNERSRKAFFDMTIFMSALPLGMLAWGVTWVAFKGRKLLKVEFEEREDPGITPEPANRAERSEAGPGGGSARV